MAYGDGTLKQLPDGRWHWKKVVNGKPVKRTGRTKTEVRAKMAQAERAADAAESTIKNVTVGKLVDDWLTDDMLNRGLAPSTELIHRTSAKHITRLLGNTRVADLTVRGVEDALKSLAADGLSKSTIKKVRSTLKLALDDAIRREELDRNVAEKANIPRKAKGQVDRKSMTVEDARAVLAQLREERNGLAYALCMRLGMRPGEAFGLHWADLAGGIVNIRRGVQMDGNTPVIVPSLKTKKKSFRAVTMPDDLLDWLVEHKTDFEERRANATHWADPQIVFASEVGSVVNPNNSRRALRAICKRAGVPEITRHELRHTAITLAAHDGVPPHEIADMVGHTDLTMINEVYRHQVGPTANAALKTTWAD
jgi:integrase